MLTYLAKCISFICFLTLIILTGTTCVTLPISISYFPVLSMVLKEKKKNRFVLGLLLMINA